MKLELKRETKVNGDIFYFICREGLDDINTRMYGGNTEEWPEVKLKEYEQKAYDMLRRYKASSLKNHGIETLSTINTEENDGN